jgi:hypothetical protein
MKRITMKGINNILCFIILLFSTKMKDNNNKKKTENEQGEKINSLNKV